MRTNRPARFGTAISLLLILAFFAAGCTSPALATSANPTVPPAFPTQAPATDSPAAPTAQETILPTPTNTAIPQLPLTQYQLDVQFDYTNHLVSVAEVISITNRWQEPLTSLVLDIEANEYPGVFVLDSLALDDGTLLSQADFTLADNRMEIPLSTPLMPDSSLTLSLNYRLNLPAIPEASPYLRPDPFGYSARQTNLVNWYPYLAAYNPGSGWLMHPVYAFGEHEVYDAADYSVNLELINAPADLKIAASAPAEVPADQPDMLHYSLPKARTFVFSASPIYETATRVVGSTTVTSYTFPWDASTGEAALDATARALALYDDLFGPYDRPTLNVVEADFLDGMEYDGLYFLSNGFYNLYDGTPSGYLTAIAVHETAHQWWYGKVGSDQALEPWLDEAMATYSEKLYYEHAAPGALDWWQSLRIDYYGPQGMINLPVSEYRYYEPYRNAVYLNGATFLQGLRDLIGDDAFFGFLKDYATKYAYQRVTTKDFFDTLREHTSADLSPLIAQYFDPSLYP